MKTIGFALNDVHKAQISTLNEHMKVFLEDLVIERSTIWLVLWNEQLMKRRNVPNPKQNQLD